MGETFKQTIGPCDEMLIRIQLKLLIGQRLFVPLKEAIGVREAGQNRAIKSRQMLGVGKSEDCGKVILKCMLKKQLL
jgi:hypothetical protein